MKTGFTAFFMIAMLLLATGCAYRYYFGFHGPSIRQHPDAHESVIQDKDCLECHHPDNAEGPPTPHPDFKGCLKCHNDELSSDK